MPHDQTKGYRALRSGRISEAGWDYFITFCTANRRTGLQVAAMAGPVIAEFLTMQQESVWVVRCATIMPDHVHLLIRLGDKLSLGKTVARLKARTAPLLRTKEIAWQPGYFDHRLRPQEDALPYFYYTYLNPYRANLLEANREWPWFICGSEDKAWFIPMLDLNLPVPEWLGKLP